MVRKKLRERKSNHLLLIGFTLGILLVLSLSLRPLNPPIVSRVDFRFKDKELAHSIEVYSEEFQVDAFLVCSLYRAESRFRKYAYSTSKARGYGQLKVATAIDMAILLKRYDLVKLIRKNPRALYNTKINVMLSIAYIRWIIDKTNPGDILDVIASYNAGLNNKRGVVGSYIMDIKNYYKGYTGKDIFPLFEQLNRVRIFKEADCEGNN